MHHVGSWPLETFRCVCTQDHMHVEKHLRQIGKIGILINENCYKKWDFGKKN